MAPVEVKDRRPRSRASIYRVTEKQSRRGAVGHTPACESGCYIELAAVADATDVGKTIDAVVVLRRPSVHRLANGEMLLRKLFQSGVAFRRVVVLADAVAFASDKKKAPPIR